MARMLVADVKRQTMMRALHGKLFLLDRFALPLKDMAISS